VARIRSEPDQPKVVENEPEVGESEPVKVAEPDADESEPEADESGAEADESEPDADESGPEADESEAGGDESELESVVGRVKWFDATRGFGFIVSDALEGDILVHFSVLREHGRRSLPEGAVIECVPVRLPRGLQAKKVIAIDLSTAASQAAPRPMQSSAERADRQALAEEAGEYETLEVKWFNRVKGYGFLVRGEEGEQEDVFIHMETVRDSGLGDLQPEQRVEARVAKSAKGLTAVEIRLPE